MARWLPDPVAFTISMAFLLLSAAAIALLDPEVRAWLAAFEPAFAALVGAFAAAMVGLIGLVHAFATGDDRRQRAAAARRSAVNRTLAAALRGELVAAGHWLAGEITAGGHANDEEPWEGAPGYVSQAVFEANVARIARLGPPLTEALTFCHAALANVAANGGDAAFRQREMERLQPLIRTLVEELSAVGDGKAASEDVAGRLRSHYLGDGESTDDVSAGGRGFALRRVL